MKATSRRRVLISSVAMLLVAMLALGTATFAWFTSSTVATAEGLNVRTSKASKLQISDYSKSWGTNVNYEVTDKVLLPASSADGASWWTADAATATNYAKGEGNFKAADAPTFNNVNSSNYVYKDQLNVRNAGDATVENVTVSWTMPNFDGANYLRIALVPAQDQNGTEASGAFAANVYDKDDTAYDAVATATTTSSIDPSTTYSFLVGGDGVLDKDETYYYNLYIWFEGQDEQCVDGNAGQVIPVDAIEFTVSGQNKAQV